MKHLLMMPLCAVIMFSTASVAQGPIQATQFHPEKSGDVGLQLLKNFIET